MEEITRIATFIVNSFIHIWPYLAITIPLAVGLKFIGATKHINSAFSRKPLTSIIIATAVGAISPFCSCGVIPVIASLLIGGVPLAPVMSFWIASPSMDPEIFFLSVTTIGWKLSIWRLSATFAISLLSGFATHYFMKNGFLGSEILRTSITKVSKPKKAIISILFDSVVTAISLLKRNKMLTLKPMTLENTTKNGVTVNCCIPISSITATSNVNNSPCGCPCSATEMPKKEETATKLLKETWKSLWLVVKFMTLAFLVNALIEFYVPKNFLTNYLGNNNWYSVIIATLVGIPFYTSNLTALPLISGLLSMGMNQGAALAFLIAGPVTTIPAMMAVWGIVRRRVFFLYIIFSLFGAILFGFLFNLVY